MISKSEDITPLHDLQEAQDATIDELRAFVAIAHHGSFASAARTLGRDTSVLSRRINALERRLGTRLLARSTRAVTLTEAGEHYYRRVQTVLEELEAANREVSDLAVTPRGVLRVTMPLSFGRRWIVPLLPDFMAKYPDVRVDARFSDRYVDLISEGFDLAVRIGQLDNSGQVSRRIGTYRTMLLASPDYLSRRGTPRQPEELVRHDCLSFAGNYTWPRWPLTKDGKRCFIETNGSFISDSADILVDAAAAGLGIILAPDWHVFDHLRRGELIEILPGWSAANDGPVSIVMPPSRIIPAKSRAFIEMVSEQLRNGWNIGTQRTA